MDQDPCSQDHWTVINFNKLNNWRGLNQTSPSFLICVMIRKIIFLLLALFCVGSILRAQDAMEVKFDEMLLDIGTFPKDSSVRHCVFKFKNQSREKLYFYKASPDCPCVSVELPKKPVPPGSRGEIHVTYDGRNKEVGEMRHWIYFHTNIEPKSFRLRISGVMVE